jgi:Ran GTPase-activating protein (RanGAP) involved in mRNA processing and transport
LFFSLLHIDVYYLTQTLTQLILRGNDLVDQAAQYMADALRNNTVRKLSFLLFPTGFYYLTQTLTELDLSGNGITEKGAQYLADALRTNIVRDILFSSF